jgi:AGCS family alanine or glycine:cation symporter
MPPATAISGIDVLNGWLEWTSGILWGPWLLVLLVGTHIFLTLRLGVIQRWLWPAIKLTFRAERTAEGDVSPFGALATALAATVGAGNIIGVAVAVSAGGPGAIFWMWITGVLGIATKYAEALLAVQFRVRNDRGEMSGGPMFVLARGLNLPWLGVLFAIFTVIAAFGIGNMFQAKAVTASVLELMPGGTAETPIRIACGLVMATATGLVLIGGIKWIARFCEVVVPLMIVGYLLGCGIILVMFWDRIPMAISLILTEAFSGEAVAGGGFGAVIAAGVKRGLFSNESGLGSAPIAAAAARARNPAQQALVSMTGTFWDTVVVCLVTGLVLVVTGAWNSGKEGAAMTHHAFGQIPHVGTPFLTLSLITFVFSTLIGWSYYGEKALEYLGGLRLVPVYRWLWVLAIFLGATFPSALVINFSDSANALMAIPNLISLLLLSGLVTRESKLWLSEPETFG